MVPAEFELTFPGEAWPACKIWFKENEMGVKFVARKLCILTALMEVHGSWPRSICFSGNQS
jgi:hypothetical protein